MESIKSAIQNPSSMSIYNDISRVELKFIDRQKIIKKIASMTNVIDQSLLLSKLVEFKYYRQNNVYDEDKQEKCWDFIEEKRLLPQGIELRDLMSLIKDDGLIYQEKLPREFKELLLKLSPDDRKTVLRHFVYNKPRNIDDRTVMSAFLTEATGETWKWEKPVDVHRAKHTYNQIKEQYSLLTDQRWIDLIDMFPETGFSLRATGQEQQAAPTTIIEAFNELKFDDYISQKTQRQEPHVYAEHSHHLRNNNPYVERFSGYVDLNNGRIFHFDKALDEFSKHLRTLVSKCSINEK